MNGLKILHGAEKSLKMKTIQELEEELIGLEKSIQFETERKALKWYLISYVEVWF